jgi:ribosomal protein S18 acetylase RimI-like enzyme
MPIVEVGPGSPHLEAFFRLTPAALYGADFRPWYEAGGWDRSYRAFTWLEGDRAIANVSFSKMLVRVAERDVEAYQLATVGTHPEHRSRGHARRLMDHVLGDVLRGAPVFLFANESTTAFYPRFGFRPRAEHLFRVTSDGPLAPRRFRRLFLRNPRDLALLRRAVDEADFASDLFSAKPLWGIVLFHALHGHGSSFHWCEELQLVLAVTEDAAGSVVHDVWWRRPVPLADLCECLGGGRRDLTLRFAPDRLSARLPPTGPYEESPLFARGLDLPSVPFKFPSLSQT